MHIIFNPLGFPWQQWLHVRASVLMLYIHCLLFSTSSITYAGLMFAVLSPNRERRGGDSTQIAGRAF